MDDVKELRHGLKTLLSSQPEHILESWAHTGIMVFKCKEAFAFIAIAAFLVFNVGQD